MFSGGIGYREIIQGKEGDYVYIKGVKLDEKDYIELSLDADEKSLALHRMKENSVRYNNPISKTQAAMIITGFIMIIILTIGIIYCTIAYVGAGKDVIKVAKENTKVMNGINKNTEVLNQIGVQQAQMIAALSERENIKPNITRQIS